MAETSTRTLRSSRKRRLDVSPSPDSTMVTASEVNDTDFKEQAEKKPFSSLKSPSSTSPKSPPSSSPKSPPSTSPPSTSPNSPSSTSSSDDSLSIPALPESSNRSRFRRLMVMKLTGTTTDKWKEYDEGFKSLMESKMKLYALKKKVLLLEIEKLEKMNKVKSQADIK